MKNFTKLFFAAIFAISTYSCNLYPDDEARIQDLDIYLTLYDTTANFQDYTTYAIVDEVRAISDDTINPPDPVSPEISNVILSEIKANMLAYGYILVDTSQNPDLGILAGALKTTYASYNCYPGYWYGWGWGYPGYGWGYPYCYPYVTTYDVGTIVIDMFDFQNFNTGTDTVINAVWSATLRGLEDNSSNKQRIQDGIDQVFNDSPYLIQGN